MDVRWMFETRSGAARPVRPRRPCRPTPSRRSKCGLSMERASCWFGAGATVADLRYRIDAGGGVDGARVIPHGLPAAELAGTTAPRSRPRAPCRRPSSCCRRPRGRLVLSLADLALWLLASESGYADG